MPLSSPFKFAVLSYFHNFESRMKEFNNSLEYTIDYFIIDYSEQDLGTAKLLREGYDVILIYSTFFHSVKNIGYFAIQIQKTDMDIIQAVLEAREKTREIGLTIHANENINIELLEKLCDVSLIPIRYNNIIDLEKNLNTVMASGCRAIVGGGFSSEVVQNKQDISYFPVEPTSYSFRIALNRAKIIAQMKREEQLHHEQLLSILKLYNEGVVFIDENENCIYSNITAAKLLSPTKIPLKQNDFSFYFDQLFLTETLNTGISIVDKIVTINKRQLIINVIPFSIDSRRHGAVAFIRDLASLYDFTGRIRASQKQHGFVAHTQVNDILGKSSVMKTLRERINTYAPHDASILIHGETGTGKDLVAQAIHNASPRRNAPFLAINCAAIPETLLESELFGYEEGAFTGAKRSGKAGVFEMAHGGTLFLDEVGDLGYSTQLRLLRVLETREVIRVGGSHIIPVDIRIISASHKSLPEMVQKGNFRADLFYRLACLRLQVPPLRHRLEDIPDLLTPLLHQYGKTADIISPAIFEKLSAHTWPGNVRELRSVFESYTILLGQQETADPALFCSILDEWACEKKQDPVRPVPVAPTLTGSLKDRIETLRRQIVQDTIIRCSWNKQQAARELGISYNTLWRILSEIE